MPRSTVDSVKAILPSGTSLTDDQINAAIAAATLMVDRVAACITLSDDELTQTENYLSAHFAALTDISLTITSEPDACGGGSVKYGFVPGKGVMGTTFGQTADMLSRGELVQVSMPSASGFAIGDL
jgi:hypothetical protein